MSIIHRASVRRTICLFLLVALTVAVIGAPAVSAAPAPNAGSEEQRQRARQEDRQRRERERQKDVFLQQGQKAARDTSLPDETPAFPVDRVVLAGDGAARFPWAQAILDAYAGRRIGAQGVALIAKRLTNAFIDRGYITTRVTVPEQDLSEGVLVFVVVPGRIGAIRFARDSAAGNWQTAFPARPGDTLNLRDLEQGLEQLKRVPSQDAAIQIVPGGQPGYSDIVLTLRETKRWRLALALDDSGQTATGKLQSFAALAVDNPFGANDLFTSSASGDGDREGAVLGTRGYSFSYSVPRGNSTLTFASYASRHHQTLATDYGSLLYWGTNETSEVGLTTLLHRDQVSKTSLDAKVIFGRYRNYLEGVGELDVQRQTTTAFQLGLSQRRNFGGATLDVALAGRFGVPWFGAQDDPAASPTTRYRTMLADVAYNVPVSVGKTQGRYSVAFHGQYTRDRTYSTEFVSLGNRFTVRGFDGEQTLAAEYGWYLRNELALPAGDGRTEVYLGLDCGAVGGPSATGLSGRFLAGAVIGLRGETKSARYDLFAGWPLRKPAGFTTASTTYGFQLVYSL